MGKSNVEVRFGGLRRGSGRIVEEMGGFRGGKLK
jgi:hypothetical protein